MLTNEHSTTLSINIASEMVHIADTLTHEQLDFWTQLSVCFIKIPCICNVNLYF